MSTEDTQGSTNDEEVEETTPAENQAPKPIVSPSTREDDVWLDFFKKYRY